MSVDRTGRPTPNEVTQLVKTSGEVTPKQHIFLTQKLLSERWHVSQGTIISWRDAGRLPFFRLPGTSKILYPLKEIMLLEIQHTTTIKEDTSTVSKVKNFKRKKPVVSANSPKEWRI